MNINNILNEENISFLKALSNKLKTQKNYGTAKPLIFQIADYGIVPAYDGCGEAFELCTLDGESLGIYDDLDDSFIKDIVLHYEEHENRTDEEIQEFKISLENESCIWTINDLIEEANLKLYECNYEMVLKQFFLTKDAAIQHLKANIHHYNREKAHIYCSHAWRTPELEKLLQIVEKF